MVKFYRNAGWLIRLHRPGSRLRWTAFATHRWRHGLRLDEVGLQRKVVLFVDMRYAMGFLDCCSSDIASSSLACKLTALQITSITFNVGFALPVSIRLR